MSFFRALAGSLLAHGIFGLLLTGQHLCQSRREPVLVDLTVEMTETEPPRSAPQLSANSRELHSQMKLHVKRDHLSPWAVPPGKQMKYEPVSAHPQTETLPVTESRPLLTQASQAEASPALSLPGIIPGLKATKTEIAGAAAGKKETDRSGSAEAKSAGRESHSEQTTALYLREHFDYIRTLVGRNVIYPGIARKMGWRGRVVLSFTINADGTTENIRIAKSSGYQTLDRSAMEAIVRTAPFPHPPIRAELALPVEFVLE